MQVDAEQHAASSTNVVVVNFLRPTEARYVCITRHHIYPSAQNCFGVGVLVELTVHVVECSPGGRFDNQRQVRRNSRLCECTTSNHKKCFQPTAIDESGVRVGVGPYQLAEVERRNPDRPRVRPAYLPELICLGGGDGFLLPTPTSQLGTRNTGGFRLWSADLGRNQSFL
jgi:hypothetical protein